MVLRQDDLRRAEQQHVRELMGLRADYDEQLRDAEAARINAIRAVDVGAAAILANQVAASAEALRGQVEAARQQTALALGAALEPIQKDIQDLRRAQYEAQGQKTQVVETSTESRDQVTATQASIQAAQARMQLYALFFGLIVIAISLYTAIHK